MDKTLKTKRPDLYSELLAQNEFLTYGSNKVVEWVCPKGHIYSTTVKTRVLRGTNCTVCSGRTIVPGINDLATVNVDLASQLVNKELDKTLSLNSSKVVEWKCSEGHIWKSSVSNRAAGKGCRYCRGNRLITGVNDLETLHPDIAKELVSANPKKITSGSPEHLEWKCFRNHVYQSQVWKRTQRGSGCPYCSGRLPIVGETDLATTHPEIASTAVDLDPTTIKHGSGVRGLWKCKEKGHYYSALVHNRVRRNCPKCVSIVSGPEKELLEILKPYNPESQHREEGFRNLDILLTINGCKIGIEYDGAYWHKDLEERDRRKTSTLLNHLDYVVRIREYDSKHALPALLKDPRYLEVSTKDRTLEQCVEEILTWYNGQRNVTKS